MGLDFWIPVFGVASTVLLVVVGLLNFSVFRRQLHLAHEQIDTAVRQLELASKQPDLHLIQRAIAETSEHVRLLVDKPYLRPYFYDNVQWREGDRATRDELLAMGELILNNFASALMHSAAFPEYPVRGIDRSIMFHLRHSPLLRDLLFTTFDRFPFTGLTLLCFKNDAKAEVEADLSELIAAPDIDEPEMQRRQELLRFFRENDAANPLEFAMVNMQRRR